MRVLITATTREREEERVQQRARQRQRDATISTATHHTPKRSMLGPPSRKSAQQQNAGRTATSREGKGKDASHPTVNALCTSEDPLSRSCRRTPPTLRVMAARLASMAQPVSRERAARTAGGMSPCPPSARGIRRTLSKPSGSGGVPPSLLPGGGGVAVAVAGGAPVTGGEEDAWRVEDG